MKREKITVINSRQLNIVVVKSMDFLLTQI